MHIGYSRRRLSIDNMPSFDEVKAFAMDLLKELPHHHYEDEVKASRIVMLMNDYSPFPRYLLPPNNKRIS